MAKARQNKRQKKGKKKGKKRSKAIQRMTSQELSQQVVYFMNGTALDMPPGRHSQDALRWYIRSQLCDQIDPSHHIRLVATLDNPNTIFALFVPLSEHAKAFVRLVDRMERSILFSGLHAFEKVAEPMLDLLKAGLSPDDVIRIERDDLTDELEEVTASTLFVHTLVQAYGCYLERVESYECNLFDTSRFRELLRVMITIPEKWIEHFTVPDHLPNKPGKMESVGWFLNELECVFGVTVFPDPPPLLPANEVENVMKRWKKKAIGEDGLSLLYYFYVSY